MPARRLVLASSSPARLRLLREAGFDPEVMVSGIDEVAFEATTVRRLVIGLAAAKADAVATKPEVAGAIVLACDSLLDVDGEGHGKPDSIEHARLRLTRLRGRSAVLRTGHCLIDTMTGRRASDVASTEVFFGDYSDEELDSYLDTGEALQVAGSFTLDGRSAPFLSGIVGDHGNVIGVSLPLFRRLLGELDLTVMDLWV
jgi:septum formation protein